MNLFPAAASSTQTSTKTSLTPTKTHSIQTKKISSTFSKWLSSSSDVFSSFGQTSSTISYSQASSASSSTSAQTAIPVVSTSSAPVETVRPSPPSNSDTAAIAAGTVGATAGAIFALMLMLLILKRRKRGMGNEVLATQRGKDLRSQRIDVNGAGGAFQGTDGSGKSWDTAQVTPLTDKLSQHGTSKRYLLKCTIDFLP